MAQGGQAEERASRGEGRGGEERVGDVERAVASASALRLLLARAKHAIIDITSPTTKPRASTDAYTLITTTTTTTGSRPT